MKTKIIITFSILLIILNFSLQTFDIYTFSFNKCGFYLFDSSCMDRATFITNKLIRFIVNSSCLLLLVHGFTKRSGNQFLFLLFVLIFLLGIDLFFAMHGGEFFVQLHKILNPIVYSPLVTIAYIGSRFFR
ncbi:MAG: hypothetical protein Q8M15_01875 [Bacteroidota bacterium]|nr:hypothetical protein [Bacteroidota bacterium]